MRVWRWRGEEKLTKGVFSQCWRHQVWFQLFEYELKWKKQLGWKEFEDGGVVDLDNERRSFLSGFCSRVLSSKQKRCS